MIKRKFGIIGAGPAGLAALKAVLDSPQYKACLWDNPIALEAKSNVGGVWNKAPSNVKLGTQSPIYDSLTTNLPYPVMAFSSFNFPPNTPLYPTADVVQTYLECFAEEFDLSRRIVFGTRVVCVDWDGSNWIVEADGPDESVRYQFDMLMVCNGHYSEPRYPRTPGLESWLATGSASHSVFYRNPSSIRIQETPSSFRELKDATILVIGGGPSGSDISAELVPLAKRVLHSFSPTSAASRAVDAPPQVPSPSEGSRILSPSVINPIPKPRVVRFSQAESSKSVYFEDGSVEHDVDYCVLATGYKFSYHFFEEPLPEQATASQNKRTFNLFPDLIFLNPHSTEDSELPSLAIPSKLLNTSYSIFPLASHLFGYPGSGFAPLSQQDGDNTTANNLPPPTSIAFLGLNIRVAPLPLVEAQARAAVAAFAHHNVVSSQYKDGVDWEQEQEHMKQRWKSLAKGWEELNKHREWENQEEREMSLRTHLSKEWHRFEKESMQFEYRDRMDDLACRLQSQMSDATQVASFRVRRWEPEMYAQKVVLRRAWVAWARKYSDGRDGISLEGVKLRNEWSHIQEDDDVDGGPGEPGDTVRFMRGLLRWYADEVGRQL
ncbi:FAD/NAD(P)-binding domain-containing protein [Agrocybe pediades]|nr:FAD/NAD(P)-binding domain-containing protein [Agrocybe pediades]